MNRQEALDIFKCLAWHDLRPSEEEIEMAFKVLSDNSVLEDIKVEIKECINACEELKSGKYPMIESEESLTNRILSYKQCLSFIDKHISGKDNTGKID